MRHETAHEWGTQDDSVGGPPATQDDSVGGPPATQSCGGQGWTPNLVHADLNTDGILSVRKLITPDEGKIFSIRNVSTRPSPAATTDP
jgi:hypothetical protein